MSAEALEEVREEIIDINENDEDIDDDQKE